ncbi:MAG: Holliday junction branch migration protein RuvA [Gemmatimonadales bacterium]|nr:MAG: Holliday junction branch migration protein RuvA [Gemmatimonadales bacterium]
MISRICGTLLSIDEDRVEISTPGGVVYEVEVPLTVAQRLPAPGDEIELRTVHLVREDLSALYGFIEPLERTLFSRLLNASGVGGKLALAMLSTYSGRRLVQIIAGRDIPALVQVSGIGKKKAEKIMLELADRLDDLQTLRVVSGDGTEEVKEGMAEAAVRALVALGMPFAEADGLVRAALKEGKADGPDELIRRALANR